MIGFKNELSPKHMPIPNGPAIEKSVRYVVLCIASYISETTTGPMVTNAESKNPQIARPTTK